MQSAFFITRLLSLRWETNNNNMDECIGLMATVESG